MENEVGIKNKSNKSNLSWEWISRWGWASWISGGPNPINYWRYENVFTIRGEHIVLGLNRPFQKIPYLPHGSRDKTADVSTFSPLSAKFNFWHYGVLLSKYSPNQSKVVKLRKETTHSIKWVNCTINAGVTSTDCS